jgi:hypothetical protein
VQPREMRDMRTQRRGPSGGGFLALPLITGACGGGDTLLKSGAQPGASATVVTAAASAASAAGTAIPTIQAEGQLPASISLDVIRFPRSS